MPEPSAFSAPRLVPHGADPTAARRRFVVGVSGASGAAYALRLLELLLDPEAPSAASTVLVEQPDSTVRAHRVPHEIHLVVSEYGQRLLFDEAGIRKIELQELCPRLARSTHAAHIDARLIKHPNKDVGAVIASGSFIPDGMAVLPCSSTSLGAIATGAGSNLLTRAAMVTLKERRPLIVCHREMPLNLVDIEHMRTLALAGATLCSPNPGFYLLPKTLEEIIDFTVGKVLDLLGVEHDLKTRWAKK